MLSLKKSFSFQGSFLLLLVTFFMLFGFVGCSTRNSIKNNKTNNKFMYERANSASKEALNKLSKE